MIPGRLPVVQADPGGAGSPAVLMALAARRCPRFSFGVVSNVVGWPVVALPYPISEWPTLLHVQRRAHEALLGDFDAACDVVRWYRVLPNGEDPAQREVVQLVQHAFRALGVATSPRPAGGASC